MRYGLIGDSQAGGLLVHLRTIIEAGGDTLVWTRVQNGITTARALEAGFFDPPENVDIALVAIGGNDTPGATYADTLRDAATRLRERAGLICWVGPAFSTSPNVAARHEAASEAQRAALAGRVEWVDGIEFTRAFDLTGDGVHFTTNGYRAWAERFIERAQNADRGWRQVVALAVGIGIGGIVALLVTRA